MRLVDNLLHHFPFRITYDPYAKYPGGQDVGVAPLFDLLVAATALILGGGRPSEGLAEAVAAFVPPILGSLTVFVAYGLGRALFSERAGLFAAALAAVAPGQFFVRSSLGFVDHHVAEVLFSSCALLFLVRALESPAGDWRSTLLAGLFLGAYLLSWGSGSFMVCALTLGAWAYLVLAVIRGRAIGRPAAMFAAAMALAALLVAPLLGTFAFARLHLIALVGGIGSVALLAAAAAARGPHRTRRGWFGPLAVLLLVVGALAFDRLTPSLSAEVRGRVQGLRGFTDFPVGEARPLLYSSWPLPLLAEAGTAAYLGIVTAPVVAWSLFRTASPGRALLLAAFALPLAATFGRVRFAYYLAVPAAVLAGFACDRVLARAGRWREAAFLVLIGLVFVPNVQIARLQSAATPGPSDDWHEALTWMRSNTPEPFGDPGFYFARYTDFADRRHPSAYGVTSWWDSGYWIARIARRPPSANPTQFGAQEVAAFFLAEDETSGAALLDRLRSRYVVVDSEFPVRLKADGGLRTGFLGAAVQVAGRESGHYYEYVLRRRVSGEMEPLVVYYPLYYRTMATRLYALGGRGLQPRGTTYLAVLGDEDTPAGSRRILERLTRFDTYEEALSHAALDARARIVGLDPLESCVPLEPLRTLTLVHSSPTPDPHAPLSARSERRPSQVQVFEYRPGP
jgi:dolichyl-diphosphooligosaccharide--protein glycosyltransferase